MKVAVQVVLCGVLLGLVSAGRITSNMKRISIKGTVQLPELSLPKDGQKALDINCDILMDGLITELQSQIIAKGLDPYPLVSEDILGFIDVTGELLGLSTINRTSECDMTMGATSTFTFDIGITDMVADIDLEIGGLIPYEASAEADFAFVNCMLVAEGSLPNGPLEVTQFAVEEISNCDIILSGLGIFDYLADDIATALCEFLDQGIADLLDGTIENMINDILGHVLTASDLQRKQIEHHYVIAHNKKH